MRFAYIDSQGNEVAIPSVDALALRIELGAIGPETELYDAQADRWGAARTHEIFHTLTRESEEEGFVAPPPPVASTSDGEEGGPEGTESDQPTDEASGETGEPGEPEVAGTAEGEEDGPGDDLGFELTLADEEPEPSADAPPPAPDEPEAEAEEGAMEFGLVDDGAAAADEAGGDAEADGTELDLASADLVPEEPAAAASADDDSDDEPEGFDFGGMDTLEMEGPPMEEEDDQGETAMDLGDGMQMEEPLDDGADLAGAGDASGGLDLEQPMSEFSSDSPPSWMEQDGPSGAADDDGDMAFDVPDQEEADEEEPARARPSAGDEADDDDEAEKPARPRSRPSPPRRKPQRSFVGPVVALLAVAALGAGGWFGWQTFQDGASEPQVPDLLPVTIPVIPVELLPTMRDLGEQALAATIDELEAMGAEADLPAEPRQDWLSGVYLANASQFSDVEDYWVGIESFLERVREQDTEIFHEKYQEALASEGITGDTATMLLERADSGFLATRQARAEAYTGMQALVDAALELHDFLLTNESEIEYDPAAGGMSADPVLEAVPSSRELGDEMWNRVDGITAALDQLGTLDRVTTERLMAVLFDRIRRAGFQ